jgi:hypothetical protein
MIDTSQALGLFNTTVNRLFKRMRDIEASPGIEQDLVELLTRCIVEHYKQQPDNLLAIVKDTSNTVDERSAAAYHLSALVREAPELRPLLSKVVDPDAPIGDVQIRFMFASGLYRYGFYQELKQFENDPSIIVRGVATEFVTNV